MSRGQSRRSLFGIGAAGGAALLLAATEAGQAKAEELDGELLAACAQYQRIEAEQRRLGELADCAPADAWAAAQAAANAVAVQRRPLVDAITDMPARTPEGLRAKALVVWAFYNPEPPADSIVDDIMWQVICMVAGKPVPAGEGGAA